MKDMLKKPPKWLKKIGNKVKQKNYLLDKLAIRIYERFEFIISKDFTAYIIQIEDGEGGQ